MKESTLLTILDNKKIKDKVYCQCACGNLKWINFYNVQKKTTKSCGCLKKEKMKQEASLRFKGVTPSNKKNYVGKTIGVITVQETIGTIKNETYYNVICSCGNQFKTRFSSLRRSKYQKCRCNKQNKALKNLLRHIIERCENKNSKSYKYYGERGIGVYEEWKNYPIKFIEWAIENGWKKGLSIDRIDSKKGYYPENCQFITPQENARKAAILRWKKYCSQSSYQI